MSDTAGITTLSSAQTPFVKFVFPALWIAIFGIGTLLAWLDPPPNPAIRYMLLALWVFGAAVSLWWTDVKRVRVDDRRMYISNYRREIVVPLSDVQAVTENRWINLRPVTVWLRSDTPFGQRVRFTPKTRFLWPWREHPVLAQLRALAVRNGAMIA